MANFQCKRLGTHTYEYKKAAPLTCVSKLMKMAMKISKELSAEVLVHPDNPCGGVEGQRGSGRRETHFLPPSPPILFASFPTSIPNLAGATLTGEICL